MSTQSALKSVAMPASHVNSLAAIEDGYWWYAGRCAWAVALVRRALKEMPPKEPLRYADLGCGTGGFASHMKAALRPRECLVADGDPAVLVHAKERGFEKAIQIDFRLAFQLPWRPNLVSLMDVLEHVENDHAFLEHVTKTLLPNGLVVISVPAHPMLFSEWDRQLGHHRRYTASTLNNLVKSAGLEPLWYSHMWSFLMPAMPIRFLKGKRYQTNMEFEPVSPLVNFFLKFLSKIEYKLARTFPLPFGTSLILVARKSQEKTRSK